MVEKIPQSKDYAMIDLEQSPTIYRETSGKIDCISHGAGPYLYTTTGRRLFDFSGGPCVNSLGHNNYRVIEAIHRQLQHVPYVYSGFWATEPSQRLGEVLQAKFDETWPQWFGKVAFACTGAEGVEFACRLATQYHIEMGAQRTRFAARKYAYHGTTLLAAALTDDYGKYMLMSPHVELARADYLVRVPGYSGTENISQILQQTEDAIEDSAVAALILEPVGGPPVGAATPPVAYLQGLREICDRHGVLLIFDEVLCGSGRCGGYMTVAQKFNVQPDLIVLGKGITSGYLPLSAIIASRKVIEPIHKGSGVTMIGTTYFDHTTSCAAALACLQYMDEHDLFDRIEVNGPRLRAVLSEVMPPLVHRVQGAGFLYGLQLRNPMTGSAFPGTRKLHASVRQKLYDAGIIVYSKGQTVDGLEDYLMLSPPFETPMQTFKAQSTIIANVLREVMKALSLEPILDAAMTR